MTLSPDPGACLDEEDVTALLERRLTGDELAAVEAHVDRCARCRTWVAQAARDFFPLETAPRAPGPAPSPPPEPLELSRGTSLGRYMLLEALGAGGMGVVFLAYDPQLDRKVALKLLRVDSSAGGQARLLAEGQAMARLSHPNVLAVHDVGTFKDRVFVTLEYVEGQTLSQWLAGGRPWREVLEVFLQAGEGLRAAHAAGIVHRDFKPTNVLVGADLRVRVADFGLAGITDGDAGERGGTPAYMAPEQHLGHAADARADQFSFCVALAEALYGSRPFEGDSAAELAAAVTAGRLRPPSRDTGVPGWVWRVIEPGLSASPAARYPSMDALLAALGRRRSAAWRRWLLVAAGLGVVAAAVATPGLVASRRVDRCAAGNVPLGDSWSPQRRTEARVAFIATGAPFAGDTWQRVEPRLDEYAGALTTQRRAACEASLGRGELPEPVLVARLACIERGRHELEVLVGLFSHADRELVGKAVEAVSALSRLDRCAELTEAGRALDPATAARANRVRADVSEARALEAAGRYQQGQLVARRATTEAAALGLRPIEAEAELAAGRLEERLGQYQLAEASDERALWAAEAGGANELAAEASTALVTVQGTALHKTGPGRQIAHQAAALIERAGNDRALTAQLLHAEATLDRGDAHYVDAERRDREALALRERLLPPEPLRVAQSLMALASDLRLQGKYDEALAQSQRALELHERLLGPEHPEIASSVASIAILWSILGRFDEALVHHRRVLDLRTKVLPADHPDIARAQLNLGTALTMAGKPGEGLAQLTFAIAGFKRAGLRTDAATALVNAAQAARLDHQLAVAAALATEGLALRLELLAPAHPDVGYAHVMLGDVLVDQGHPTEGIAHLQQGVEIWEKALGSDYSDLADPLSGLGRAYLAVRAPQAAIAPLERALKLVEKGPAEPSDVAEVRLRLAQALWDGGGDRTRAVQLATTARDSALRAGAEAWLKTHRASSSPK